MDQLWFTRILNALFARPADLLLGALHVPVAAPQAPINNTFAMEVLVALIMMLVATLVRMRLSVDAPGAWQQAIEASWKAIGDHGEEVIGHGSSRFLPYLFTLAFFILLGNMLGMIPSLETPTAAITVTVGLALCSFFYYHAVGIRKNGVLRYAKTFLGPVPLLAPLMLPIEIISHFARILSLSVRLFANMFAGELITSIFIALMPIAGVLFMGLHVFVALLQAYIFVVLTMIYLAGAVAEEH